MRTRDFAGLGLIAAVLIAAGWFIDVSPREQVALRTATRDRPTVIPCAWTQPWNDPAYVMSGWSQPQAWWHQPKIKVLWSNGREAHIVFHAPNSGTHGLDIGIKYPAISAPVEVLINGKLAGSLDRNAKGNDAPHLFTYRMSSRSADNVVDLQFITRNASRHDNDGRYLGVLLEAVRVCQRNNDIVKTTLLNAPRN